jgi:hypothetical protein
MRNLTVTICLTIAMFLGSAGVSFALPPCDKGFESLFACSLEVIESTHIDLRDSMLKPHQREFDNLLRLRIRNDLSMFRLGNQDFFEFLKKQRKSGKDRKSRDRETQKRATLSCLVMTVGDSNPVAQYTECELSGWGQYTGPYPSYKSRILGYSNRQDSKEQVRKSIRRAISDISSQLLERRDKFTNL